MSEKRDRRRRKNRLLLLKTVLVVLAGLLVLMLAAFLFFGRDKETEPSEPVQAEAEAELPEEEPEEELEEPEPVSTVKEVDGETEEMTDGIDVSEFQGNIDWDEVAESGVDFVMVRVGYRTMSSGEIVEDRCAKYNLQEAAARNIYLGAYFFSTAVSEEEVLEEAQWTADFLAGYPITYPVAYNCEGFQNENSRQHDMSVEERSALAEAFLKEIEERGYTGMFYAARNELAGDLLWDASALELHYRMWVAQYSSGTADKPDYDGLCAMWQYTNQGSVPGIDGDVDMNKAFFGYKEVKAAQEEGSAEQVEADIEVGVIFEEVEEQVTSKDVTNLRSTMDQGSDGNIVATLQNGDVITRTGKGNNGWSRLLYNGEKVYAVSSYLTTDLSYTPPSPEPGSEFKTKFTSVTENVTAKEVTNLRNRPSVEEPSEVIVQLHNGEVIARTGVSELGWSRVEYNGQTLYCISSYLTVVE